MIARHLYKNLVQLGREFPVIAVLGPRQVGKTTLVKKYAAVKKPNTLYLDMEKAGDRSVLTDPEIFFNANRDRIIVIDEVQLMPELFTVLRPEIDALRKPGRFILTGSASPDLVKGVSESLAGRIAYLDASPISLPEARRANISLEKHWFRGGFPTALTAPSNDAYIRWAENFVRSYVERDLSKLFGSGISPQLSRNFWSMVALANGQIWNAGTMSRSLGVTAPTVTRYLDFMEGAFLLRRLPAWFVNAKKRLVKAPKVYVRDSGILHFLNHVTEPRMLAGHPVSGSSWEGYVIEEVCKQLPYHIKPFYYRTHHGAEADLVLVKGVTPVACIEIKYSMSPTLSPGFYNCIEDLKTINNMVIYPGDTAYTTKAGIKMLPLHKFIQGELKKISS